MLSNKRLPSEDLEALERVLLSNDWKIVLKYVSELSSIPKKKLLDAKPEDPLLYLKGMADGSKELCSLIHDFKKYFKDKYLV